MSLHALDYVTIFIAFCQAHFLVIFTNFAFIFCEKQQMFFVEIHPLPYPDLMTKFQFIEVFV